MDPTTLLERTFQANQELIAGLSPEDYAKPTPCRGWDVTALINHMIGVNQRFAAAVSGQGSAPAADADLVGSDAGASYRASATAALVQAQTRSSVVSYAK